MAKIADYKDIDIQFDSSTRKYSVELDSNVKMIDFYRYVRDGAFWYWIKEHLGIYWLGMQFRWYRRKFAYWAIDYLEQYI